MNAEGPLVLVVEDEPALLRFLRTALKAHGHRLIEAGTIGEARIAAVTHHPELVLLDLGLPDGDGLDLLRELRGWSRAPVIVLSARGREEDKVAALDAGADDYLTKPFGTGELLARIRVALRHAAAATSSPGEPVVVAGDLRVDLASREVRKGGEVVHLTPHEHRLLAELARHAGKVLTHRHLLREVWGPAHVEDTHYLRVYMAQLRAKLEDDPNRPTVLKTETGVGYRFVTQAANRLPGPRMPAGSR